MRLTPSQPASPPLAQTTGVYPPNGGPHPAGGASTDAPPPGTSRTPGLLEASLFWGEQPVRSELLRRRILPPRLRGALLLGLALAPLGLAALALVARAGGHGGIGAVAGSAALGFLALFCTDVDGWRSLVRRARAALSRGDRVYVGQGSEAAFFVPLGVDGKGQDHPLVVPYRGGWALNLSLPGVRGHVRVAGQVLRLDEAQRSGAVTNGLLPMASGTQVRLTFGDFSMLFACGEAAAQTPGPTLSQDALQEAAYVGLSVVVHGSMLVLFVYMQPDDEIQIRRARNQQVARLVAVESVLNTEKRARAPERLPEVVEVDERAMPVDATPRPTVVTPERLTEAEPPTHPVPHAAPRAPAPRAVPRAAAPGRVPSALAKATAERLAPTTLLAAVTGRDLQPQRNGLTFTVIRGPGPGDGAPESALAQYAAGGSEEGDRTGGYRAMDFGPAAGPDDSPGSDGPLAIAGLQQHPGERRAERLRAAALTDKGQKVVVDPGPVAVAGGLSKGVIQQYMNRQKGQLIACYKRAVQKTPSLEGKAVLAFTIAPSGKVMAPAVLNSTLRDATLEACIANRLGLFRFPQPDNAGAVKVTYPFLFRTR